MALKDWKKVYDRQGKTVGDIMYDKKDMKERIKIFYDNANILFPATVHMYVGTQHYIKSFKSKSQALKFAKSYMRTH